MIDFYKENVSKFYSDKNLFFLFSSWILTFIFGSSIGSYSFGSFTIYPNLIIGLFFIPLILRSIFSFTKSIKIFVVFLSLFLFYSISWILIHGSNYFAVFELRSHIFYLNTFLIIISTYNGFYVKDLFKKALKDGLWFLFTFIVLIGFIERLFHIHLLNDFYSRGEPMFIFGNANDYFLYCFVLFLILLFVDVVRLRNFWMIVSCLLFLFMLAHLFKTLLGEIIIFIMFVIQLSKDRKIFKEIVNKKYYILFVILSLSIIVSNKFVKGDERTQFEFYSFLKTDRINAKPSVQLDTSLKTEIDTVSVQKASVDTNIINESSSAEIIKTPTPFPTESVQKKVGLGGGGSLNIRVGLILNGIYLFKNNPIFGVGPGQFQEHNRLKKVPYNILENYSPHNYFIELISNYALLGISFFLYLLYLFFLLFKLKTETSFWLKVTFVLFFIVSILPSAFIYQPMNWLFMSLWILYSRLEINLISVRK